MQTPYIWLRNVLTVIIYDWCLCFSLQGKKTRLVPNTHWHSKVWPSHKKNPALYGCCYSSQKDEPAIIIKEPLIMCVGSEAGVCVNWKRQDVLSISPTDELVRTAAAQLPVWPADVYTSPQGPVNLPWSTMWGPDPGPTQWRDPASLFSAHGLFSEGKPATI